MTIAPTVNRLIQRKLENKINIDWNLDNPHEWADRVIGRDIYEMHTRHNSKWLGWNAKQIAFMRDVCDLRVPIVYAVCNRGGSKTMLTSYSTTCLLDNLTNFKVAILSGSKKQAAQAYTYISDVLSLTSLNEKVDGEVLISRAAMKGGGGVEILAASPKQTKAPRADMVIIDEACSGKSAILQSVFGQIITSQSFKIVILTTPDNLTHIAKVWWDEWEDRGIVRHHWDAYQCNWIPQSNIDKLANIYDDATFAIEVQALWTPKGGSIFSYADIQAALIDVEDLPALRDLNHVFMGIDWGDAHDTVATVVGVTGDPAKNNDKWWVYAVKAWNREKIKVMRDGIKELNDIYEAIIISEQSPISAFMNRELKDYLAATGTIFRQETFSGKKWSMINLVRKRLEDRKYKIPRHFRKFINQHVKYARKLDADGVPKDEVDKKEDDYVDSGIYANWGIHPMLGKIETLGEWEYV